MSELSSTTGTPVPTLKFYLREGLLPAGVRTSPNQAQYDETHVARVRLVRALLDVGGLTVAQAVDVISALDDDSVALSSVFGVAQYAVSAAALPKTPSSPEGRGAERIAALCEQQGWRVYPDNPGLAMAARVVDTYAALDLDIITEAALERYAQAADLVASADLAAVASVRDEADMTTVVVVGTILGDALFAGLRRIAQEAESFRRFPLPEGTPAPGSTTDTKDS